MLLVATVLAQSSPAGDTGVFLEVLKLLLGGGVAGAVVILFLMGRVESKGAIDRLVNDRDRAEARNVEILKQHEEKWLPAFERSNAALADAADALAASAAALARMQDTLDHQSRTIEALKLEMVRRGGS